MLHRCRGGEREVLLVHPGGPMWARRDAGVWSIPKGEYLEGDDPLLAARREFEEELGTPPPSGPAEDLGEIRQRSGKRVRVWALEGELDVETVTSNTCEVQWPPHSGRRIEIPEVDRAQWFTLAQAAEKLIPAQAELLERLTQVQAELSSG